MYKIGEFSKMVNLPVRTLRYYDECGVLQPKEVDVFTNYRYYTDENIVECELIKLLKSVNFTLDEIAIYKNNLDEEVISKKEKEIFEQIELMKMKLKRLAIMKEEIKEQTPAKVYSLLPKKIEKNYYGGVI